MSEFVSFEAPAAITLCWCPTCGRDDRITPFTGFSHWQRGVKCSGLPITLTYQLAPLAAVSPSDERTGER